MNERVLPRLGIWSLSMLLMNFSLSLSPAEIGSFGCSKHIWMQSLIH